MSHSTKSTKEKTPEIIANSVDAPVDNKKPTPSVFWPGFWSIAIPAYCYFFGYASFKYELDELGFDAPDIPTAAGEVYFNAFNAFVFLENKTFPAAEGLLKKHYVENWHLIAYVSIAAVVVTYLCLLYINIVKKEKPTEIKNLTMNSIASPHSHGRWISQSALIGVLFYIGNFTAMPLILGVMGFISFILLPPPLIGINMAHSELQHFECPIQAEDLSKHSDCALITLKDGKNIIGKIFSRDTKFLYVLTRDAAKSIPVDQILQGERKVHTGKIKAWSTTDSVLNSEFLYCHQSLNVIDNISAIKPPLLITH